MSSTLILIHPLSYPFIYFHIHSQIHSSSVISIHPVSSTLILIHPLSYPFIYFHIHSQIHSSILKSIHAFSYPSFISHPFSYPFIHPSICSSNYQLIFPFIYPSIHSFINSLDTYTIAEEGENGKYEFKIPFHYAHRIETSSTATHAPGRALRLAQEVSSLSTSLPLSPSSSVFVRCDEERLDIMKVRYL